MTSYPFCLGVHRLRLELHLGVGEDERSARQAVEIELRLFFPERPAACDDDDAPFLSYDDLAAVAREVVAGRSFRLIEYLAAQLFDRLRARIDEALPGAQVALWLRLHKCTVPTPGIEGGTSVTLTDLPGGLAHDGPPCP